MTTESIASATETGNDEANWKQIVARYQKPSTPRAVWQILNTLVPYGALWYLMYLTSHLTGAISYWLTVPLAILAGLFLVRMFIIFHDCGHGSFFKSKLANEIVGCVTGVLTFTPYHLWRWEHAIHHSASGDLDRRGTGDIWTLTVEEYLAASRWKRFSYRLARNPIVLFVLAPLFLFLVLQRMTNNKAGYRESLSVYATNLVLVLMATALSLVFGFKAYLLIQFTILMVAGSVGVWLFYVQHQFEGVYWERNDNWDYAAAALQGSSFYKLPKVLQWFSGNIGFHHIHHLSPRIPNYNLEKCHDAEPLFQAVKPVTFFASFKSFTFRLWDEQRRRLIGYRQLRAIRKQQRQATGS
ncbi:MAG: fatty acid desaturase [Verrucomicrobia bacterium]|nr:MAG: fatty acid desaturase [Verrucomicrobiota bacterium]